MPKSKEAENRSGVEDSKTNEAPTRAESSVVDSSPPPTPTVETDNSPAAAAVNGDKEKEPPKDSSQSSVPQPVVNGTSELGEENKGVEGQQQPTSTANDEKPKMDDSPTVIYKVTSPELSSKTSIRQVTWKYLDSAGFILFPRPCIYRIPRFQGENEAVEKLASLDAFKKAKIVKTNLDKSHERLRFEVINSGKELVVGAPGLREAVFYHMRPPVGSDEWRNHMAASRLGITSLASALIFNSETKADLIILGSVAVDKKGRRVGKGDGFSDLEFALLSTLGGITPDATIVTVVHDAQVYEELPESIFENHDVPVDIIVTPSQVIHVDPRLPRPTLHWDLLSLNRINEIPVLKLLMDLEKSKGVPISLKPNEPPAPIPPLLPRRKFFRNNRRQPMIFYQRPPFLPFMRPNAFMSRMNQSWARGKTFIFNSRNGRRSQMIDGNHHPQQQQQGQPQQQQNQQQRPRFSRQRQNSGKSQRPHSDVIRVKGLNSSVRIRSLKAALYTRGVRPSGISWRPKSGLAILYFNPDVAPMPVTMNGTSHASADELVTMLKGLSVNSDDGSILKLNFETSCSNN